MARKTKEDAEATRKAIQRAALELFSARGVSETTLSDVAKTAGVTRGAIYWHFQNKEALLRSLKTEALLPYERLALEGEREEEPDPLGKLKASFLTILADAADDAMTRRLFQIWLDRGQLGRRDRGESEQSVFRKRWDTTTTLQNILKNAVKKGQLPENFDTRLGAMAVLSFIDGALLSVLLATPSKPFKEDVARLTDAFFHSLHAVVNPYMSAA